MGGEGRGGASSPLRRSTPIREDNAERIGAIEEFSNRDELTPLFGFVKCSRDEQSFVKGRTSAKRAIIDSGADARRASLPKKESIRLNRAPVWSVRVSKQKVDFLKWQISSVLGKEMS